MWEDECGCDEGDEEAHMTADVDLNEVRFSVPGLWVVRSFYLWRVRKFFHNLWYWKRNLDSQLRNLKRENKALRQRGIYLSSCIATMKDYKRAYETMRADRERVGRELAAVREAEKVRRERLADKGTPSPTFGPSDIHIDRVIG